MSTEGKDIKARVRHRGSLQGGTEILIDRLDEEKKRKVLHYLRANQMELAAREEDQVISVEVSAADSKKVSNKIVSYMRSIGLDDVSVSSAHFDRTKPEIEEESLPEQDYTLIGSEDARELARRLEAGEESEFELIVSSIPDVASLPGGGRWRSSDVIRTITGSTRQNEAGITIVERNEQGNTAPLEGPNTEQIEQSKKSKWWRIKANRFVNFFKRKKQNKTKNEAAETHTKKMNYILEGKQLNSLNRTKKPMKLAEPQEHIPLNKINNTQSDNKNKTLQRLSDAGMKKLKPLKNVKKILKATEMRVSEACTQTDSKKNKKYSNTKHQTLSKEKPYKKSRTTSSSGECCTCCSAECTSTTVHPQFVTLPDGVNRNLPFYHPLWRQPFYYLCQQNPFYQMKRPHILRPPQERILVEPGNMITQTTTSETTNTVTCSTRSQSSSITRQERKIYRRNFQRQERRKIQKNDSTLGDGSSTEENFKQSDSSTNTWKKFTSLHSSVTMRNTEGQKHNHSSKNKISHQDSHKLREPWLLNNNSNFFEEQLTELHDKIEEIALRVEAKRLDTIVNSFQLSTNDKKPIETIDRGVECIGLDNHQKELYSKKEPNSSEVQETKEPVESQKMLGSNIQNFQNGGNNPNLKTEELNYDQKDGESHGENEHLVLNTQKITEEEKPMKNGTRQKAGNRSKRRTRREEHTRRGIVWDQYPEGWYGYGQSYDPGQVVPVTPLGTNYTLDLPYLQGQPLNRDHRKKRRSRCKKLCSFLTGENKTSNLREQLLQQKLDLLEMKTVLAAINYTIRENRYTRDHGDVISESEDTHPEDDEENSEDYSSKDNINKCENGENVKEDIQFSLSRPKNSKKTVTFRTPLID